MIPDIAPALAPLRASDIRGDITAQMTFQPGLSLQADPALKPAGQFRSPAGRLLELDITCGGTGDWIALHVALSGLDDLADITWIGLTCRHAAPHELMIRPCLRSGGDDGFTDCFFDKHMLGVVEARNHVDALHVATTRAHPLTLPDRAPWRELLLFLPKQDLRWDLHDLRLFAL